MPLAILSPVADKADQYADEQKFDKGPLIGDLSSKERPLLSGSDPRPAERAVSILVVEDQGVVAMLLVRKLRHFGYTTPGYAMTGQEAIEKARSHRPDLILMDINLRGSMDGIAAAAAIQAEHNIPVIYLTAYGDEATIQRTAGTTCYGYLIKPFNDIALQTTIIDALARIERERRADVHEGPDSKEWD